MELKKAIEEYFAAQEKLEVMQQGDYRYADLQPVIIEVVQAKRHVKEVLANMD